MTNLPNNRQLDQAVSASGQEANIERTAPSAALTILPSGRTLEKCFSAMGREFTIERPPGNKPSDTAPTVASSNNSIKTMKAKADFGITVDWRHGGPLNWKPTSKDVQETAAITQYMLIDQGTDNDGDISCTLYFTNTEHYGYHFYDHTGDSYWVSTWRNGDHSVGYSSQKPDINFITGD